MMRILAIVGGTVLTLGVAVAWAVVVMLVRAMTNRED